MKIGTAASRSLNAERKERWLVIAHEASNSGAPKMLLEILRGVRAARGPGWSCEILLRRGGPLLADFERLGPVHLLSHRWAEGPTLRAKVFRMLFDRPWGQPRRLAANIKKLREGRFDLIYNNTATNEYLVPAARSLGAPVLTHVHETAYVLRNFLTREGLEMTLSNTDHFLAVSPTVIADLVGCGVSAERITLLRNFLPSLPGIPEKGTVGILRKQLRLPLESFVVLGCGHIHQIKGTDLFVELAAALAGRISGDILFVWLGGETDARFARQVRRLVRRRNLERVVRFVGPIADTRLWLAASDAVAVTSRVESFSLFGLEAAALGRPVVGFSGARGLKELLGDEPKLMVRGIDVGAMAAQLGAMRQDTEEARQLGLRLRAKVEIEFLAEPLIATLLAVVDKLEQRKTDNI